MATGGGRDVYGDLILPMKLAIDTWYVEHASPFIDLLVVVSLLQRFVFDREVTMLDRRVARDVPEMRGAIWWCESVVDGSSPNARPPSGLHGGLGLQ